MYAKIFAFTLFISLVVAIVGIVLSANEGYNGSQAILAGLAIAAIMFVVIGFGVIFGKFKG